MSNLCCCLAWLRRRGYEAVDTEAPPGEGRHHLHSKYAKGAAGNGRPPAAAARSHGKNQPGHLHSTPVAITGSEPTESKRQAFIEKYELKESIGIGSTSACYRCVHIMSGKEFAVKIIDKRKIEAEYRGMIQQFYNEIDILKALRHPNIIQLEEVIESETKIYIVMELMRGGELFDYIVSRGKLREDEAQQLARKIISAVAYMHEQDIIHRDLKPENLLLTTKDDKSHDLKLIDFGLSKCMHGQDATSFLGTKGYLAPEMLQRHTYSKAVDCWAMGIIVFILLCGCLPFDDDTSAIASPLLKSRFQLRFPHWAQNLSEGAKSLLRGLLTTNPRRRLTAAQALNHPWVLGRDAERTKENYLKSPHIMGRLRTPRTGRAAPDVRARQRANEEDDEMQRGRGRQHAGETRHHKGASGGGGGGGRGGGRGGSGGRSHYEREWDAAGGRGGAAAGWEYHTITPSQADAAIAHLHQNPYGNAGRRPQKRPSF